MNINPEDVRMIRLDADGAEDIGEPKSKGFLELFNDIRKSLKQMTPEEKKVFWRETVCPWPKAKDNKVMWVVIFTDLAIHITADTLAVLVLISSNWNLFVRIFLGAWILWLSALLFITSFARNLRAGLKERDKIAHEAAVSKIRSMVKDLQQQAADKLAKASGREKIDLDPISIAAARLDAQEKIDRENALLDEEGGEKINPLTELLRQMDELDKQRKEQDDDDASK